MHFHHGHGHGQMNIRAVLIHIIGDMVGSVVVMVSTTIIIIFSGQKWTLYIDPAMSLILVCIILKTTIPLLSSSARILLLNTPKNINVDKISRKLKIMFPCIQSISQFHVWNLDSEKTICKLLNFNFE